MNDKICVENLHNNIDTLIPQSITQNKEIFSTIFEKGSVKFERIISTGQVTPTNEVYDQKEDEFVLLSQGYAKLWLQISEYEEREIELQQGDYIIIPKHVKHRVVFTSKDPPCIWLCFFFNSDATVLHA